jgi:hypothetical protein
MSINILITEGQYHRLFEGHYNYHDSHGLDIKDVLPYGGQETRQLMTPGRDTGHFGTGTYFSTYGKNSVENRGYSEKYGDNISKETGFIKVAPGLYRISFNDYPNLYKCSTEMDAQFLFDMLHNVNNFYHELKNKDNNVQEIYDKIINLAAKTKLDIPSVKQLIEMAENLDKTNDRRTLSTVVMQYNGYNGVDVSDIPKFDNTLHGSVIYDLKNKNQRLYFTFNDEFIKRIDDVSEISDWIETEIDKCKTNKEYNDLLQGDIEVYIGKRNIGTYNQKTQKFFKK